MAINWENWIHQLEWYAVETQLATKPKKAQSATFLVVMEPDATQILNSFNLLTKDQEHLSKVKIKIQEYVIPKVNISVELLGKPWVRDAGNRLGYWQWVKGLFKDLKSH